MFSAWLFCDPRLTALLELENLRRAFGTILTIKTTDHSQIKLTLLSYAQVERSTSTMEIWLAGA